MMAKKTRPPQRPLIIGPHPRLSTPFFPKFSPSPAGPPAGGLAEQEKGVRRKEGTVPRFLLRSPFSSLLSAPRTPPPPPPPTCGQSAPGARHTGSPKRRSRPPARQRAPARPQRPGPLRACTRRTWEPGRATPPPPPPLASDGQCASGLLFADGHVGGGAREGSAGRSPRRRTTRAESRAGPADLPSADERPSA
jgi:prepilin-type processing-associated H-X9-DG protein